MAKDFHLELTRLLREHGWSRVPGGKGSHEKWRTTASDQSLIVPHTKSRHMANSILKDAGIDRKL